MNVGSGTPKDHETQDSETGATGAKPSWWTLRIWVGITARVWFPMWARHRFRVSPSRLPALIGVVLVGLLTGIAALLQHLRFKRRVERMEIPPPIFIVGHWRSGTTFLHELLATNPNLITPTYLECFATDHFLQWGKHLNRIEPLAPKKRPMDDVDVGFDRPQEDEFGLLSTGAPSPYECMLFPRDYPDSAPHLDIAAAAPASVERWKRAMRTVMKRVVFARVRAGNDISGTRLLLKSPTHTARIGLLREMFPTAKFVHLVRSPFDLFPSSIRLWSEMADSQGIQVPDFGERNRKLVPFINTTMKRLYGRFDADIATVAEEDWVETRYEELVRDPVGEISRICETLGLPPPDHAALDAHVGSVRGHRRNPHRLDDETEAMIRREWAWYFERFGYDPKQVGHPATGRPN